MQYFMIISCCPRAYSKTTIAHRHHMLWASSVWQPIFIFYSINSERKNPHDEDDGIDLCILLE